MREKRLFVFGEGKENQTHPQYRQGDRAGKRKPEGIGFIQKHQRGIRKKKKPRYDETYF
jgi:hypothetical protein